ncbi:hypothetical protein J437_LFUL006818 [Ladona fulva]|uniref:Uncharacterized protein n=1 Tax=Ladona fulva TaxID=123851 RepID=A0A8K0P0C8_LADFU|nr:hypothetical protein J437_LFUL006818 [Ladona fulva]
MIVSVYFTVFDEGFLVDQDTSLFKQLFELHEAMEELKEKLECECCFMSDESSETSSISSDQELPDSPGGSSPNTSTSTLSYRTSDSKPQPRRSLVHHTSFVRQRVSYPPSARNRYSRAKGRPSHHSQGSYDSGIHTPDHEIFV